MSEEFNVFPKTTARAKNLNIVDTIQHFSKGSIIAFVLTDKDGVWIFLIFIDSSLSYRIILIVQSFASQFRQIKTSLTRSGMYGPKAFLSCVCGYHPKRWIIQIMTLILEVTAIVSWFCLLSLSRKSFGETIQ